MAIVKNAEEEHQYLFCVNTISMVKSDALFSYIPPSNVLGWIFSPLRWCMPFRQFVRANRTIIKLTHFPILALIYTWEKIMLLPYAYEPESLIEQQGHGKSRMPFTIGGATDLFSPGARLRKPSVATHQKERALEEVFRRPFDPDSIREPAISGNRRENVVDTWMKSMSSDGELSSPPEQSRDVLDRLETRKPSIRRSATSASAFLSTTKLRGRVLLSDPEQRTSSKRDLPAISLDQISPGVDADVGTSESGSHDSSDQGSHEIDGKDTWSKQGKKEIAATNNTPKASAMRRPSSQQESSNRPPALAFESANGRTNASHARSGTRGHTRNTSTNTIVFNPVHQKDGSSASSSLRVFSRPTSVNNGQASARAGPPSYFRRTSQRPSTGVRPAPVPVSRPRPVLPSRRAYQTTSNVSRFTNLAAPDSFRRPSMDTRALDLASDIGDNRYVDATADNPVNLLSTSFQTQLNLASLMKHRKSEEESNMVSRMVLARMNTIEEGFKDILKEVRGLRSAGNSRGTSAAEDSAQASSAAKRLLRLRDKRTERLMQQRSPAEEALLSSARPTSAVDGDEAAIATAPQMSTTI